MYCNKFSILQVEDTLWTEAMTTQVVRMGMTQAVATQVEEDMIQVVEDTVKEDIAEVEVVIQVVAEEVVVIQVAEDVTKVNCLS